MCHREAAHPQQHFGTPVHLLNRCWQQISLPVAIIEGEGPVGLSLIGWRGGDEVLLALATRLEGYCHPTLIERNR